MKKCTKQTERYSISPVRAMISALMLFAVLGVTAPAAVIAPVPTNLHFMASYGDTNAIPSQTFALTVPVDVSATAYVLATTNSWIVSMTNSVGDVSGTVPAGGTNTITVTVVVTNLPVGDYNGKITVGANWSDVTVALCVHERTMALAADFDGDGLADPAVYNDESELWAIKLSSLEYRAATVITSFGGCGWQALAGDFDGDGIADPAIYQASTGTWKIKLSTAGWATITKPNFMGSSGWMAIAADFDGDGLVDPTIYKASTGSWVVMLSASGYHVAVLEAGFLGSTGYAGMAADFDGDGYADPTVAKTSMGNWKIRLSSGGAYSLLDLPGFLGE